MITAGAIALLILALKELIQKLLFIIGKGLCWVVGFLTDVFEVVSGLTTVTYKGSGLAEKKLLIKVFFGNSNINTIYWGMALIGIVMCFGFAIAAVIKKSGDIGDKMKQSIGDILRNCFKGITLILLMNFIISSTISITSTLLDRINYLIVNAQSIDMSYTKTFDEEEYACMARILNKIGNYSLNASYNSRYNLNLCYNDIRDDLEYLADEGVFDVSYISTTHDSSGKAVKVNTWQSVCESIYRAVDDVTEPQPLDEYNTKISEALLDAMEVIKNDASFEALKSYLVVQQSGNVGEMVSLDRMIMLLGSMYGSGGNLTKGTGMQDNLRGPYYRGDKDIFSYSECERDFDMSFGSWLYLTVIIVAFLFLKEMLAMVFNATARIFNMLLLYLTAPPFIAVTPLDDGGKLKQWTTAFIIQSFGLFGTVISLRLVMIFIPALFNGDLQIFDSVRADTFARVIIMYGAIFTARKASGMIVGILADNAGMQAISAGDVGSEARNAVDRGRGIARRGVGMAVGAIRNDIAVGKKIGSAIASGGASAAAGGAGGAGGAAGGAGGAMGGGSSQLASDLMKIPGSLLDMGARTSASVKNRVSEQSNATSAASQSSGSAKASASGGRPEFETAPPIKASSKEAPEISSRYSLEKEPPQPTAPKANSAAAQNKAVNQPSSGASVGGSLPNSQNKAVNQPSSGASAGNVPRAQNVSVNQPSSGVSAGSVPHAQNVSVNQPSSGVSVGGSLPNSQNKAVNQPSSGASAGNVPRAQNVSVNQPSSGVSTGSAAGLQNKAAGQSAPAAPKGQSFSVPASKTEASVKASAMEQGIESTKVNEPANKFGSYAQDGSKTYEDSALSERRNRSIPDYFKE